MYTLGEAAKATGKSKATISKALKSGKISGSKGENGAYRIDASELHRVYPPTGNSEQKEPPDEAGANGHENMLVKELEARLEAARERLADKDEVIADLREDRDRWRQQATALLEDKRPKSFLKRLLGR